MVSLSRLSELSTIPNRYLVRLLSISGLKFRKAVQFALYWAAFAPSFTTIIFFTLCHHYFSQLKVPVHPQ